MKDCIVAYPEAVIKAIVLKINNLESSNMSYKNNNNNTEKKRLSSGSRSPSGAGPQSLLRNGLCSARSSLASLLSPWKIHLISLTRMVFSPVPWCYPQYAPHMSLRSRTFALQLWDDLLSRALKTFHGSIVSSFLFIETLFLLFKRNPNNAHIYTSVPLDLALAQTSRLIMPPTPFPSLSSSIF